MAKTRDALEEAVEKVRAMRKAALETAKTTLVNSMAGDLRTIVNEATKKVNEDIDPEDPEYDEAGEQERVGDEVDAVGDDDVSDDVNDDGEGPAIVEDEDLEDEEDEDIEEMDYEEVDEDDEEVDFEIDDEDDEDDDELGECDDMDEDDEVDLELDDEDDEEIDLDVTEDEDEEVDLELDDEDDEDLEEVKKENLSINKIKRENHNLRTRYNRIVKENKRYEKAIEYLKNRIDEVNVFNAKLGALVDLNNKVPLTKNEKIRVAKRFDECTTVREVKRLHTVLKETYSSRKPKTKTQLKHRNTLMKENKEMSGAYKRLTELAGLE